MRKGTILLAAIFAVGMTTAADAAKKKAAPAKPDPAVAAQQNTANLVCWRRLPAVEAGALRRAKKKK